MGTYTPPPSPTYSDGAGGGEVNGALTAYANVAIGASQNYLQGGTGPTKLLSTDSSPNLNIGPITGAGAYLRGGGSYVGVTSSGAATIGSTLGAYNGANTALQGVGAILAGTAPTHETNSAPGSTTLSSPAAGMYRVFVSLDVKTATTLSATMKVTYTDSEGTAQSDVLVFLKEGSVTLLSAVVAADRYVAEHCINTNGATNIVVADNSGTYTTCDYYYAVAIERLA